MSLKKQLIRLGHQNPDLRKHLRPVLDTITASSKIASKLDVEDKLNDIFDVVEERYSRDDRNYTVWEVSFPGGQVEAHYSGDKNEFTITDSLGQQVWYVGTPDRRTAWGPVYDAVETAEDAKRKGDPIMAYFRDTLLLHY